MFATVYLLPSALVAEVLFTAHRKWLAKPGEKGQPHKDSAMRRLAPDYTRDFGPTENPYPNGWLDQYRDAWHLLHLERPETWSGKSGSEWPVIIRRRVIIGRRPCQLPDRRGDDQRGGADDGARHAKWPRQWKRRARRITPSPSPSRRGTPSRGTRGLIVRRVPAARLKASEFVAVQLSGRALRRRLLLRIVLRLGGRKRQSDEPGGDRGRNRSLADTHGASGIGPRAPRPANVSDARRRSLLGLGGAG